MRVTYKFAALILIVLNGVGHLCAQRSEFKGTSSLILNNSELTHDLSQYASFYYDSKGHLGIEEVSSEDFILNSQFQNILDFNFYWVQLRVKSDINHSTDWRLKLFDEWADEVIVYSQNNFDSTNWQIQQAGHLTKLEDLDINPRTTSSIPKVPNAVSLTFSHEEEKIIYIRFKRKMRANLMMSLELIPMIESANALIQKDRQSFYTIIFMAMLCVLAIYHLLVFFMIGDSVYLFYALYSFSAAFASTIMDEYGILNYHLFYSSHPYWQPWIFIWIGTITIAFYILFTRSYLNTKKRFPKLDIIIMILMSTGILFSVISSINLFVTGRQYLPGMPFEAFMVSLIVVFGILLYMTWRKRQNTDNFYLLGIGVMLIVIVPEHLLGLLGITLPDSLLNWKFPISILQIGLISELLIFSLGLGYRTRQIIREKQHFEELDQMKSRFFTNITHEFRTPLTLIMGPLQKLKDKLSSKEQKGLVELAEKNANNLLYLVNQVLDLSKLESKNVKLEARKLDIIPFLKGIFHSFQSLAEQKNIQLNFHTTEPSIDAFLDYSKMEIVITNILSNALKFSNENGRVDMKVRVLSKHIEIKITDTGIGISKENLAKVFDRYYQGQNGTVNPNQGSGIGLALVKELVHLHSGSINVNSKIDKGTTFEIQLPLDKNHLKEDEISSVKTVSDLSFEDDLNQTVEMTRSNQQPANSESILLIEDHADVRAFVKSHLSSSYKILEAKDGKEGIQKAIQHLPDLIVSDVMMPFKNGYEVCEHLKRDIRTSHIPIILLTAKAARNEKIEGLEYGADDYLIKPFDSRELLIRVRNLINLRKKLRTRFSSSVTIRPSEVSTNSMDQQFMQLALDVVEKHMDDESFNVAIMTKEIGISATQLNHKLRSLVDQSTNQFIKSIRLQRAAELLRKDTASISEIAFQTGFKSPAYFTSSFKSHFGMTPKTFKEQGIKT